MLKGFLKEGMSFVVSSQSFSYYKIVTTTFSELMTISADDKVIASGESPF